MPITTSLITRAINASNTTFQHQLNGLLFFVRILLFPSNRLIPFSVPNILSLHITLGFWFAIEMLECARHLIDFAHYGLSYAPTYLTTHFNDFHSQIRQYVYLHPVHSNHSYFIDPRRTNTPTSPSFIHKGFHPNACRRLGSMFQVVTLSFHTSNIQFAW